MLALERAYERASAEITDIGYVEAHGTGTPVGDAAEVRALGQLRFGARRSLPIGSIKANIGHTKAAAGFASLVKTISALEAGIIPPHVSCENPHNVFAEIDHRVRPALTPEPWPEDVERLAGVSAFGFGGINAHLVLERADCRAKTIALPPRPRRQDAELFVFADSSEVLPAQLRALAARAPALTIAEFVDAAVAVAKRLGNGPVRCAVVAGDPNELARKLQRAAGAIETGFEIHDADEGICVARQSRARLGFLFPGQAAPTRLNGGAWARRFDDVGDLLPSNITSQNTNTIDTQIAQPVIVAGSLAAWQILRRCGIEAVGACGHSLGELAAWCWAGAIREHELISLASTRGAIMMVHGRSDSGMLRITASANDVIELTEGLSLVIACHNAPKEIVVAGAKADLQRAETRARQRGVAATPLAVSHGFHSPAMASAVPVFAAALSDVLLSPPRRPVWSTISGTTLRPSDDLPMLLAHQIVAPVQFAQALRGLAADADFFIEVGPGAGLTRLAREAGYAAVSVDAFAESLRPLLSAIGFAFAIGGQAVNLDLLFRDRALRPIDLSASPIFLANPCGRRSAALADSAPAPPAPAARSTTDDEPGSFADNVLEAVRTALAEETGFAPDEMRDDDRFLDDLHLSSIGVGRIVTRSARLAGIRVPDSSEFANATAGELAAGLVSLRDLSPRPDLEWERVPGVRPWVRAFDVQWATRRATPHSSRTVRWKAAIIHATALDHEAVARIVAAGNSTAPADGLLIWLGSGADAQSTYELFAECRAVWPDAQVKHLAICHAGMPVAAFARSLALEGRFQSVLVVERVGEEPMTQMIGAELSRDIEGCHEIRIVAGCVSEPHFALARPQSCEDAVLTERDVVLVTGGAKGIGAECALRLASCTGAALVLSGRSATEDPAVAATLERARALGARYRYVVADVNDKATLVAAVAAAARDLGPITALLHVAGLNEPRLFADIDDAALERLLAPKTTGLLAAVEAAGPHLRRIITFGSILGRMGLKGEAHYAIANAWQSKLAEEIVKSQPRCRLLSLEWSIWNGAGMGHRLGSLERLARYGVDAISLDDGVGAFERLVLAGATGTVMMTSRFGPPSYVSLGPTELPMLRFLDTVVLHYPHLELVVDTELSQGRDPYLADHRIDNAAVLPGVIGLEAMAQVASALTGRQLPVEIEAVAFRRAVVVPDWGSKHIKILTLATEDGRVEAAIRSEDDFFTGDCMRATFRFCEAPLPCNPSDRNNHAAAPIDAAPLYGPLLFQSGYFQNIDAYSHLSARRIAASLRPTRERAWFGSFESQRVVLGDAGVRDALLHALQAAVPHLRVVPVSVDRVALYDESQRVRIEALETSVTADTFTFDIFAFNAAGAVVEQWQGATFHAIADIAIDPVITEIPEIVGPYVERVARATTEEGSIEVALIASRDANAEERRACALAALDMDGRVLTRSDGKPLLTGDYAGLHLSISHCQGFTLAVKAEREISCDLEIVGVGVSREEPVPLSPPAQSLAAELVASGDTCWPIAATRVWTLQEVAIKQNRRLDLPCTIHRLRGNDVVTFETAFGRTATIRVPGLVNDDLIIAIGTASSEPNTTRKFAVPAAEYNWGVA